MTLVWHPANPDGRRFRRTGLHVAFRDAINDATAAGKRWQTQLDRAAAVLQRFQAAGVPVIFRPLHEQNGNFFWWGDNGSTGVARRARQQAWVGLWRDLVTELSGRKGLKNLIFVFGTNQVNYGGVVPPLTYYPGAAWADLVSIDVYDEELDLAGSARGLRHYAALIGTGKPFGISEFGQSFGDNGTGPNAASWDARTLTRRIRDSYPRTVFAIAWYSSVEGNPPVPYVFALPDVSFTEATAERSADRHAVGFSNTRQRRTPGGGQTDTTVRRRSADGRKPRQGASPTAAACPPGFELDRLQILDQVRSSPPRSGSDRDDRRNAEPRR